jgi:phage shock protein E
MWIPLLLLLLAVPACSGRSGTGTAAMNALSTQEKAWMEIRNGALLVDVRTQQEFDQEHLEGALLIPHDRIASRASELGDDKQRTIVLYCRSGNRSAQAKEALEKIGYTNVMNAGGYESLKQAQ